MAEMEWKIWFIFLLLIGSLSQLGAAATSSASSGAKPIDKLERRWIDRPSSYHEDIASWSPAFGAAFDSDPNPFVFPFNFEHGLSERLTIVWVPVPLEFRWNYLRTDSWDAWATLSFIGPLIGRARDSDLTPHAETGARYRIGPHWRLEAMVRLQVELKRKQGRIWNHNILSTLSAGYQLGRWVFIQPGVSLLVEDGFTDYYYPGEVPIQSTDGLLANQTRVSVPISLALVIQPWRRLDIKVQMQYMGLGIDNFQSFPIYVGLNLYW